jgi:hypothetical protein
LVAFNYFLFSSHGWIIHPYIYIPRTQQFSCPVLRQASGCE